MGILKDGKDKGFILKNKLDLQTGRAYQAFAFDWKPGS
jgi:hypothetical protein